MDKSDSFTVTATTDPFSAIEITGTGSKTFTLGPATFNTANAVDPFDVMTPIIATDGDGDPQASSVTAALTPDSHTTQGTSGADILTATPTITTLLGEDGNDTLTGLDNQANLLAGGRGDDILIGGLGSDTLVGGAGNDTFVFNSTADGLDHILDFSAGDVLQFSSSAFGNLGASTLSAANFESNATGVRQQGAGTPQFVFYTANSTLYYDADGAGGSAAINMAKLENGHALTASEIHIV
jgi:Ca2+-binding RTX toxin-like protein